MRASGPHEVHTPPAPLRRRLVGSPPPLGFCEPHVGDVSHVYLECRRKRIFAKACLGKKLIFHTEICEFRCWRILTIVVFDWVKMLSKLNQTWYEVSHMYVEYKTKRIFGIACLEKKLVFHTEICEFRD